MLNRLIVRHTYYDSNVFEMINKTILMKIVTDDVLTLIEAIIAVLGFISVETQKDVTIMMSIIEDMQGESIYEVVNSIFQREFIGYRFVDGKLTPISDEYELKEVEQALA